MKTDDPAYSPKIQDLRAVATYWYEQIYKSWRVSESLQRFGNWCCN
jgi:hypothetical protein